jgi:hypothetical protein
MNKQIQELADEAAKYSATLAVPDAVKSTWF